MALWDLSVCRMKLKAWELETIIQGKGRRQGRSFRESVNERSGKMKRVNEASGSGAYHMVSITP